jgi:hypothetical protein
MKDQNLDDFYPLSFRLYPFPYSGFFQQPASRLLTCRDSGRITISDLNQVAL